LIEEFWDDEAGKFVVQTQDEIIKGCLVTHERKIVNERLLQQLKGD